MPGVPSGRACEGCRKQKKKCDERTPACSRCIRLGLPCEGSGRKRYKFVEAQGLSTKQSAVMSRRGTRQVLLGTPPANERTSLVKAFIYAVSPSSDLRYSLFWTYGDFLVDIPPRLGESPALDASADALISAHVSFSSCRGTTSVHALTKYSRALQALRSALDDPIQAVSSNTLCAVMLLLLCQALLGTAGPGWSSHAQGAAQILRARGFLASPDEFEQKVLLSLRGPVLFEGLVNEKIKLNPEEWAALVDHELARSNTIGQMLLCLAQIPVITQRGRDMSARGDRTGITALRDETKTLYQMSKVLLDTQQLEYAGVPRSSATGDMPFAYAHYQRMYGLGLTIVMIINVALRAFGVDEGGEEEDAAIQLESVDFSRQLLSLAREAAIYRPLGASYTFVGLMVAWMQKQDHTLRLEVEQEMESYTREFATLQGVSFETSDLLEYLPRGIRMLSVQ
ncbi:hypothetical protein ASPZODRAFT_57642 [Penicilliopsis zonata CBS 506.65]|uniref:Zn(2)-C6 fungal-type domain-containing protein n=1 Tax=Penicilliopsis zonata CBS 506.65 TaxID=1073090 RepID=A0A1L9ST64_9EURO|nr:hypothetical protein ASPZODRAFT_57642 [Penicilliopsis zonata CBS 506.65]OJJ50390.1 hypothetical protein ASPZODRAFT_57642 [Penicilliopsis zonata CBS 506.65]